ncbi:hypothetical protein ACTFIU_009684 [Dictyostelium citrinum]
MMKFSLYIKKGLIPPSVTYLKINENYKKKLNNSSLPSSIKYLHYTYPFNSFSHGFIPTNVQSLEFCSHFNNENLNQGSIPSSNSIIPYGLESLTFGANFDSELTEVLFHQVSIPESVESLTFGISFNRPIIEGKGSIPTSEVLSFNFSFNRPLSNNIIPHSVTSLTFGHLYDRSIINILPSHLETLIFGNQFNQPIPPNVLPYNVISSSVKTLEYNDFLGEINNDSIPPSINCLKLSIPTPNVKLGDSFNQPISQFLPSSIESLTFGDSFNQPIPHGLKIPQNVKSLSLGGGFDQSISKFTFPSGIESLNSGGFKHLLPKDSIPSSVKSLTIHIPSTILKIGI